MTRAVNKQLRRVAVEAEAASTPPWTFSTCSLAVAKDLVADVIVDLGMAACRIKLMKQNLRKKSKNETKKREIVGVN